MNDTIEGTVRGTVRWADGTPISGVAVSNGIEWNRTDDDGRFRLHSLSRPVWIRRPSGVFCSQWWQLPTSRELDFTCISAKQEVSAVAHLSDTHLSASDGGVEDAVELANRFGDGTDCAQGLAVALDAAYHAGARLAFITGDLTDHGTAAEFDAFKEIAAASPIPVEVIPGNHDHYGHRHDPQPIDAPIGDGFLGTATTWRYEQSMGPRWWSADIGPFHILALDWFSYAADIDRGEQEAFVVDDLAGSDPHRPLIVLSHDVPSARILDRIVHAVDPTASISILSGHWHVVVDRQVGPLRFLSAPLPASEVSHGHRRPGIFWMSNLPGISNATPRQPGLGTKRYLFRTPCGRRRKVIPSMAATWWRALAITSWFPLAMLVRHTFQPSIRRAGKQSGERDSTETRSRR
ncbi:hypothetical protein GCM10020255_021330 [Rhodococcus baikonurensis]